MGEFFNNQLLNWMVFFIYFVVLTYLSVMQTSDLQLSFFSFPHADKLVHFVFYFILTMLLFRGIYLSFSSPLNIKVIVSVLLAVIYGGIIELAQEYVVGGRTADIFDFLVNILGAVVGISLCWTLVNKGFERFYVKEFS